MATYTVQGEKDADVDIVGTIFKPGDSVELREDVAAPLVEAGTITAAEDDEAPAEQESIPEAPDEEATDTPEGDTAVPQTDEAPTA